jgi:isopenicillin N synthase-like dioxygenase
VCETNGNNAITLLSPTTIIVIDEDQLGCGVHTDYECFTLLSQSGLQVLNIDGK